MPTDPSIILAGKPPVIPQLDVNQTFRTLGQLKYLQATTQAKEQEAARAQQLFDETGAGRGLLSSLRTPQPGTPATPGQPGLAPLGPLQSAPGRSNALAPEPGTIVNPGAGTTYARYPTEGQAAQPATPGTPAGRPRSILDPEIQQELYRIAPHAADDLLKAGLSTHTSTLEGQQKLYESVARSLTSVTDEGSYQAWRTMASTVLPGEVASRLPANDPGPEGRAKLQQNAQDLHTQFTQAIEASKAATLRMQAKTAQQTEDRQGRKVIVVPGEQGGVPIYEYPQPGTGTGPAGTSPAGTPGTGPIPGTERPRSGEENLAAARLHQAAVSNGRLALIEAEIAGFGTDPSQDPTRNSAGVYMGDPTGKLVGVGINAQTPEERVRDIQQYLQNTPHRGERSVIDTDQGPPPRDSTMRPTNAPDTYTGKGLIRVVPSVLEHNLATNPGALGSAVGAVVGGAAGLVGGSRVGGPAGAVVGSTSAANAGSRAGGALGESIGGDLAHKALDPRRQQYYGEQLNFITAVKGDNLSSDALALARKQYFPQPGDSEQEVLRKRQVRKEAVSSKATLTNRPQGMVPRGQTHMPTPQATTYTMEDAWKASKATGRSIDDVLADAKRRNIEIRP
jgi:hypothetical protein